jgi:hypothetical protein
MSDFSELENDLKALRPARPSPVLFQRIEQAMAEDRRASGALRAGLLAKWFQPFTKWRRGHSSNLEGQLGREHGRQMPIRFGIGLLAAAAAVVLLLARINTEEARDEGKEVTQLEPGYHTTPALPAPSRRSGVDGPMVSNKFVPSGATQVVYNTRNEGLHFADGSRQPLRRLRYQTQQTWQWRNPSTGASLQVSYPSEEVVLIPVSGQ